MGKVGWVFILEVFSVLIAVIFKAGQRCVPVQISVDDRCLNCCDYWFGRMVFYKQVLLLFVDPVEQNQGKDHNKEFNHDPLESKESAQGND